MVVNVFTIPASGSRVKHDRETARCSQKRNRKHVAFVADELPPNPFHVAGKDGRCAAEWSVP